MHAYTGWVYPVVLVSMGVLLVAGGLALAAPRLARALWAASWVARVVSVVEVAVIAGLWISGATRPDAFTLIGYLVVAIAVLGLLGISRVGAPPAPGGRQQPDQPSLTPRQAAQADAVAAMIVAVTLAVVAWRLHTIVLAG